MAQVGSADLVIVGGGCVGCSIALHAARLDRGLSIVLLERQHLGWGATGRRQLSVNTIAIPKLQEWLWRV